MLLHALTPCLPGSDGAEPYLSATLHSVVPFFPHLSKRIRSSAHNFVSLPRTTKLLRSVLGNDDPTKNYWIPAVPQLQEADVGHKVCLWCLGSGHNPSVVCNLRPGVKFVCRRTQEEVAAFTQILLQVVGVFAIAFKE